MAAIFRTLFVIDKKGMIRYIDVHDIIRRRPRGALIAEPEELKNR